MRKLVPQWIYEPLFGLVSARKGRVVLATSAAVLLLLSTTCSHTKPWPRRDVDACDGACATINDIESRVLLFGDGGAPRLENAQPSGGISDPNLRSLYQRASEIPSKTSIVFLGDNIYDRGLPDPAKGVEYETALKKLEAQLAVAESSGARGIFIPGNHDWDRSGPDGLKAIARQAKRVNESTKSRLLPQKGCPGPSIVDTPGVRIIALDTEWWLHKHNKPIADCVQDPSRFKSGSRKDSINVAKQIVVEELMRGISGSADRPTIVVAHHPLATHGPHGGFFSWKDYFFPLTNVNKSLWIPSPVVLGGLFALGDLAGLWGPKVWLSAAALAPVVYPLGRRLRSHPQDAFSRDYRAMVESLETALVSAASKREGSLIIFAAGHDHSLQVLQEGKAHPFILVSGSGTKTSEVGHGEDTLFAYLKKGFMQIDFYRDRALLQVIEPHSQKESGEIVFCTWLKGGCF